MAEMYQDSQHISGAVYISLSALARRLGVSTQTVREARKNGDLPEPRRIGRMMRYPVSQLIERFPELANIGTPPSQAAAAPKTKSA